VYVFVQAIRNSQGIKVQANLFYEHLHMYKYDELNYEIVNKSE